MFISDENFRKNVGKRLRTLRKEKQYTIDNVIEKLQNKHYLVIDERTIRRYEQGKCSPKIDFLVALADLYNVSLDYLILNKETSDDNLYTWESSFKRLNRLMFSFVIIPTKVKNPNSPDGEEYVFECLDKETQIYLDRINDNFKNKNYCVDIRDEDPTITIKDFDKLIQNFSNYEDSLFPTEERLNKLLVYNGEDPKEYENEYKTKFKNKIKNQKK